MESMHSEGERTYLGAINPSGRPKSHAIAEGIDENEDDASIIRSLVEVVGVGERESTVDLYLVREVCSK
jgi:hypothetical protein